MATDLSKLWERLAAVPESDVPQWSNAEDLARLSIEAHGRQMGAPRGRSRGALRLHGGGVAGHAASFTDVGRLMTTWQNFVSAVDASRDGHVGVRGKLPASILSRSQLDVVSSPSPGSLVLTFEPHVQPNEELDESPVLEGFDQPEEQAIDTSMALAVDLLAQASQQGLEATAPWVTTAREMGQRVCSTLSHLTEETSSSDLDLDVSWAQPNRPTRRAAVTASTSRTVHEIISKEVKKPEVETLRGTLVTISDRSALQLLDPATGTTTSVKPGSVDAEQLRSVAFGERVEMRVNAIHSKKADGSERVTYEALTIKPLS
ncbi:hypothetical protein [Kocuria palustris]|uniref:hypothetical protein n=1 Tax=Kocuria palustris TaxID=71999 RepID=UPI000738E5C6|nr:hypothetical protein [Kocuria palustris]KUG54980.1 hypothetical protein AVL60_01185 [Kocuria palustris]